MHRSAREWRAIIFIFLFFHVCKSKNPISSELGSDLVVHQGSSELPCVPFFSPHFFASFLLAFLRLILLLINSANLLYSPLSPPPEAFLILFWILDSLCISSYCFLLICFLLVFLPFLHLILLPNRLSAKLLLFSSEWSITSSRRILLIKLFIMSLIILIS